MTGLRFFCYTVSMKNKFVIYGAGVFGLVLVGVAVIYWILPAGSLPSFFPGFQTGSAVIHFKHGLASFILAFGLFAFVWFQTGDKKNIEAPTK